MRCARRRHRHLRARSRRRLPHRKTHEHTRRALRQAVADTLRIAGEKIGRRAFRRSMACGARRNECSRLRRHGCSDNCIARRRRCSARTATRIHRRQPQTPRARLRASTAAALQSCFASAARAGAKSSTTVTVAAPDLPRLRQARCAQSHRRLAVRAVMPWRRDRAVAQAAAASALCRRATGDRSSNAYRSDSHRRCTDSDRR